MMKYLLRLFITSVVGVSIVLGSAQAQQKVQVPQAESDGKYTSEQVLEVGDVPGHQIRIYAMESTFPKKDMNFIGIPVVKSTTTGTSDYTNKSGSFEYYIVYTMQDGGTVFGRGAGASISNPDGSRRYSFVENLTGGTGKFKGIKGQIRGGGERLAGAPAVSEFQSGEYWVEE